MSIRSQREMILAHLERATLTPLQALRLYRCFRLAPRILELKKDGHEIRTDIVEVSGKRIARYALIN